MRIISGKFKSRKIDFPKNKLTRPMTDRTKETLFNIVGSFVFGKHVLDLYAGSGSIGLEALSRGAGSAGSATHALGRLVGRARPLATLSGAKARRKARRRGPAASSAPGAFRFCVAGYLPGPAARWRCDLRRAPAASYIYIPPLTEST